MAAHRDLVSMVGIEVFFAEPHSPWQRPTNENGSGLVRRYVGKGTDLSVYGVADLRAIEARVNTIPRRSLGWDTVTDRYDAAVAMTG
ncbi:MAG: hypothetical protein V9E99_08140 [Microthrixaceae bacterium]